MADSYELWCVESGNLMGVYDTLEEAVEAKDNDDTLLISKITSDGTRVEAPAIRSET